MKKKYSICICNYNMGDTIEQSLRTIIDQLDERFEVVIVDDGSNDNSIEIIKNLQKEYPFLKLISLERNKKRKLGQTRNISIEQATGEYVLLHLDTDDIYGPFIKDFVSAFHQIENAFGYDILLSGQHINMAKRSFLLKHGPYRNVFHVEDRDMWTRLAAINAYIPFDHIDFVKRLEKNRKQRISRIIVHTCSHIMNDFRNGHTLLKYLTYEKKKWKNMGIAKKLFRLSIIPIACIVAKYKEPLLFPDNMNTPEKIAEYREKMHGSFTELLNRHNKSPNYSELSADAKEIFY